jgi:ABC-type transport system involved in multi-copper enzyme maturation permease subunit
LPLIDVDLSANAKGKLADFGIFNFPFIWHFNSYIISYLKIFIIIVIISLISSEYSNRTLKQNLIDGLSKQEFVLSKLYMIILYALITTAIVFVITMVLGLAYSDFTEASIIFRETHYLLAFFMNHLLMFSFCLFAAMLVKRSAFALGFVFIWFILETIAFNYVRWQVDLKNGTEFHKILAHVLPLESASNLIQEPWTRIDLIQEGLNRATQKSENSFIYSFKYWHFASTAAWICLLNYLTYVILKKRDL